MAYTDKNFKTKKELKEAVTSGKEIMCYQPGLGPDLSHFTGKVVVEGPHSPEPHRWYAEVWLEDGIVKKVK